MAAAEPGEPNRERATQLDMSYETSLVNFLPNNTLFVFQSRGRWLVDGRSITFPSRILRGNTPLLEAVSQIRTRLSLVFSDDTAVAEFLADEDPSLSKLRTYVGMARQYLGSTVMTTRELMVFLHWDTHLATDYSDSPRDKLFSLTLTVKENQLRFPMTRAAAPTGMFLWEYMVEDPLGTYGFLLALERCSAILAAVAGEPTTLEGDSVDFVFGDYQEKPGDAREGDRTILVVPADSRRQVLWLVHGRHELAPTSELWGPYPATVYKLPILDYYRARRERCLEVAGRTAPLDVLAAQGVPG